MLARTWIRKNTDSFLTTKLGQGLYYFNIQHVMRLDKGSALSNPVWLFCHHERQLSRFQSLPGTCLGENKPHHDVHLFSFTAFQTYLAIFSKVTTSILQPLWTVFPATDLCLADFIFPPPGLAPRRLFSRHQKPQSRLPPKVMAIHAHSIARYYLVRTTQNKTHFLQLYTGIYAL